MCVNLPFKVISVGEKVFVESNSGKEEVSNIVENIELKEGDYVFLKDKYIVGKINKEEAKKIIKLII